MNNSYVVENNTAKFSELYIQTEQDLNALLTELKQQNVTSIQYEFLDFCVRLNDNDLRAFSNFVSAPFNSLLINSYTTSCLYTFFDNYSNHYQDVVAKSIGYRDAMGGPATDIDLNIVYENMDSSTEERTLFNFTIYREGVCYNSGEGYFADLYDFKQAIMAALTYIDYLIDIFRQENK